MATKDPCNNGMRAPDFDGDEAHALHDLKISKLQEHFQIKQKYAKKPLIYENQEQAALEILGLFTETQCVLVTLCAPMQYGKTGIAIFLAYRMLIRPDRVIRSVIVITGLSDRGWQEQTEHRFRELGLLDGNLCRVIHRGQLKKNQILFDELSDALIILDECHYASETRQTIATLLSSAGMSKPDFLVERNVRILQISATPGSVLTGAELWGDKHKQISVPYISTYIGPKELLQRVRTPSNKVGAHLNLTQSNNLDELIKHLLEASCDEPAITLVRLKTSKHSKIYNDTVIRGFKRRNQEQLFDIVHYDSSDQAITPIQFNQLLDKPTRPTIVLLKNMLRASKTFPTRDKICAVYDPPVKQPDTSVVAQGLLGRMCGHVGVHPQLRIYTYYDAVTEMIDFIDQKKGYRVKKYSSKSIIARNECILRSKSSYCSAAFENPKQKKDLYYYVYSSIEEFNMDFPKKRPKGAKVLLGASGNLPSVRYILDRKWGLNSSIKVRYQPALKEDGTKVIVAYSRSKEKLLPREARLLET